MTWRRNFTRSIAVEIIKRASANRHDGQPSCEICGAIGGKLEVHHIDMDAMQVDKSRKLTASEGMLICQPCHKPITASQRKILAKAQAVEALHLGARKPAGKIKSRGFEKSYKPRRFERASLPARNMFK